MSVYIGLESGNLCVHVRQLAERKYPDEGLVFVSHSLTGPGCLLCPASLSVHRILSRVSTGQAGPGCPCPMAEAQVCLLGDPLFLLCASSPSLPLDPWLGKKLLWPLDTVTPGSSSFLMFCFAPKVCSRHYLLLRTVA